MRNAGLDEIQAGIQIAGRYNNKLRYADDTTFMAESEEELKSLLMKVKEDSKKVGLPFPSPGDLPDPGIEPGSPTLEADALTSEPPGKPLPRLYCS